jgi:hypothetical protein
MAATEKERSHSFNIFFTQYKIIVYTWLKEVFTQENILVSHIDKEEFHV